MPCTSALEAQAPCRSVNSNQQTRMRSPAPTICKLKRGTAPSTTQQCLACSACQLTDPDEDGDTQQTLPLATPVHATTRVVAAPKGLPPDRRCQLFLKTGPVLRLGHTCSAVAAVTTRMLHNMHATNLTHAAPDGTCSTAQCLAALLNHYLQTATRASGNRAAAAPVRQEPT